MAKRLREVLGPAAVRIDHIGSTAVPGLAAKNVIDIQVSVAALDAADALAGAGFRPFAEILADHRPPGDESPDAQWAKRFFSEPVDMTTIGNVQVAARSLLGSGQTAPTPHAGTVPTGYYKSNSDGNCYPISSCSAGTQWSSTTQTCVSEPPC